MKKSYLIFGVVVFSLIFRILISPFGTWGGDMASWTGWSSRLLEVGFPNFYQSWSDYLPGYIYVLWAMGLLWKGLSSVIPQDVFFKLPSILADGVTVYLIYYIVKRLRDKRAGLAAGFIYGLSPAIFGNSALWGQSDSFATLPMVLSLLFLLKAFPEQLGWGKEKGKTLFLAVSGLMLGSASVLKPSGAFLLPLFLVLVVLASWKKGLVEVGKNKLIFLTPALVVFVLAFVPFSNGTDLLSFIIARYQVTLNQYQYTSLNAFNLWSIGGGGWKEDGAKLLFLNLQQWGLVIFGACYGALLLNILKRYREKNLSVFDVVLTCALIFLSGFLFLTRAHERHIFPVFVFMAIAAALRVRLWVYFVVLSVVSALNLRYAYVWLSKSFEQIFSVSVVSVLSGLSIGVLIALAVEVVFGRDVKVQAVKVREFLSFKMGSVLEKREVMTDRQRKFLVLVLAVGVLTRFFNLNVPPNHMFDEVYHAFTAQEMVKGNKAAWEWWNTPPQGFAYEWSHPPFAKLAMMVPLKIFGVEKAWAWRSAVAVFGVGLLVLMFLLTRELFGIRAGILATFLATFDGLILAQSRIGMNDIFFVFFMLLAFYVFVRWFVRKEESRSWPLLIVGISLGLSLASKWAGIYGFGILGFWYVLLTVIRGRDKVLALIEVAIKGLAFFVVVPVMVYLITYIPFFTSGHNFNQFVELQKQMWWYHTGLKATHPFQSQFWQWPLDLRPVWFWVDYKDTTTANIYNLGNPAIFWAGDVAVILAALFLLGLFVRKIKSRKEKLNFPEVFPLLFCFSGFLGYWLPWAHSPRIMFFYHFLPSLLFMIIILSWALNSLRSRRAILGFLVVVLVVFLYFSPIWYGIPIPKNLVDQFFWIKSWR